MTHCVILGCRTISSAKALGEGIPRTKAISLDVNDDAALDKELEKVDVVISLIPYTYHATVIKGAIRTKTNVITTSYVSPAMLELEEDAKKAGITVMNEIGLDPVFAIFLLHGLFADFSRVSTISMQSKPYLR